MNTEGRKIEVELREKDLMEKLADIEEWCHIYVRIIKQKDEIIRRLEQENEDLKGQLRQWGIDKGAKKGLFLK